VIFVDQPLYSWAKELILAYPERFDNVMVMHILINLLTTIGQHVDCAGLDDIWVDVGLLHKIVLQL
jgi:hypothetical protein